MFASPRKRPKIAATLGLAAASAAVAAAAVYFLDPSSGKQRRELMRDRTTRMYKRSRRHLHAVAERAPF
jgi:gas vesicle protein